MQIFSKYSLRSDVAPAHSGLGFGCMGITAFYGDPMPDDQAVELLKTVYDAGCRHFDTAEVYAQGDKYNEQVLGLFLKTVPRDSYSVATKYWPSDGSYAYDLIKDHLIKSLERLGLEYVDLYYAHRVTSLEGAREFGRTAKRLLEEGLIKEVGVSEIPPSWLRELHTEICPIAAVQQEWSLMTRSLEADLVPLCKELGITIVAYSPLARNLLAVKLTEAPNDWRATNPRYQKENLEKNARAAQIVHDLAEKYKCTSAQLSLAWLFYKAAELGVAVVPIPGTTKVHNALSNMEAVNVHITDPADLQALEELATQVVGERYAESLMGWTIESLDK